METGGTPSAGPVAATIAGADCVQAMDDYIDWRLGQIRETLADLEELGEQVIGAYE